MTSRVPILASLLLAGCTHHVSIRIPNVIPAERHKTWVNGWLFNLVGGQTDTARFCGDRPVARVDTRKSFGNYLLSWITFGIYTPMHATITCGQPAGGAQPYAVPPPGYYPPAGYAPPPGYAQPPAGGYAPPAQNYYAPPQ